jgi:hypothetical protein
MSVTVQCTNGPGGTIKSGRGEVWKVSATWWNERDKSAYERPGSRGSRDRRARGRSIGLWSATADGIAFLTIGPEADAIDFYRFRDRTTQRLGTLPFRVSRVAGLGRLTVSPDGRWALVSATDVWESDIMVVEGVR